jgi:hypothetical protein
MKRKIPKKPRIRAPLPRPTRIHSTKKGLKGYDRVRDKRKPQGEALKETLNIWKNRVKGQGSSSKETHDPIPYDP